MPRSARLDQPGLLQHVIVRGIEKRDIFLDDEDRDDFVREKLWSFDLESYLSDKHTSCVSMGFIWFLWCGAKENSQSFKYIIQLMSQRRRLFDFLHVSVDAETGEKIEPVLGIYNVKIKADRARLFHFSTE